MWPTPPMYACRYVHNLWIFVCGILGYAWIDEHSHAPQTSVKEKREALMQVDTLLLLL